MGQRGWTALIMSLHELLRTEGNFPWLAIRHKQSGNLSDFAVVKLDNDLVIETNHMNVEAFPDPSATMGILYRYGAVASIEEMLSGSGEVDYWTFYRVGCGRNVEQAASVVQELIWQEGEDTELEHYDFKVA